MVSLTLIHSHPFPWPHFSFTSPGIGSNKSPKSKPHLSIYALALVLYTFKANLWYCWHLLFFVTWEASKHTWIQILAHLKPHLVYGSRLASTLSILSSFLCILLPSPWQSQLSSTQPDSRKHQWNDMASDKVLAFGISLWFVYALASGQLYDFIKLLISTDLSFSICIMEIIITSSHTSLWGIENGHFNYIP